ncbi:MAG: hypothetical protein N2422_12220 [Rhodobacteraceae bacterium]|nr:hypothetical protein [Paracoccaceae bacterium]
MRLLALLATLVALHGVPAAAQSLGLDALELSAAADSKGRAALRLSGDWAITGAHGLQLDMGLGDTGGGTGSGALGQLDAHLYLAPRPGRKYGLFLSLADVDGREATVAMAGIEGMIDASPATTLSAAAALGYARPGALDFVALRGGLRHALGPHLSAFAAAQIAEIDETRLRALPWQARAGLAWDAPALPVEIAVALVADGIGGRDGAATGQRAELSLTWRFGGGRGAARPVSDRLFETWQPFDPLLRRGLF